MGWGYKWLGLFEGLALRDFLRVAQVTRIVAGRWKGGLGWQDHGFVAELITSGRVLEGVLINGWLGTGATKIWLKGKQVALLWLWWRLVGFFLAYFWLKEIHNHRAVHLAHVIEMIQCLKCLSVLKNWTFQYSRLHPLRFQAVLSFASQWNISLRNSVYRALICLLSYDLYFMISLNID
jgi:hypothetical protein